MFKIITNSPKETTKFAQIVANVIKQGVVICLEGDLGAGKTLFSQGLSTALGVKEIVTSPTFNLMNVYEGTKRIYHFDLYRLENEDDLYEIGFYEYTDVDDEVVLIEWPDRFLDCMPEDYLYIKIKRLEKDTDREIIIDIKGLRYKNLYEELKKLCQF